VKGFIAGVKGAVPTDGLRRAPALRWGKPD